jgi:sugar phosphate isomerase/epimerase
MNNDPLGTLTKLAEMGYKHVEHANYDDRKFYGYSAGEFKKVLSDLGLQMPSGHTVLGKDHWDAGKKDFTDDWKHTVEDAAALEQKFVVSGVHMMPLWDFLKFLINAANCVSVLV